ncbi:MULTISPECIES: RdgB/HAM1 family non-canonical purine NTP pyrophosphatase [Aestuariimicrobium]|uniref:RdgB/HAM1 family non-canonical purine NTP pyrophosphatase n=1 Tax=Aestuariimicrobium TaxID=396388 RepID=UPI001B7FB920|nr:MULTISPECIES: RdgB/HAM1 family non-canonical purine NTP pyrophosphatase [Aestuariimicrobium]
MLATHNPKKLVEMQRLVEEMKLDVAVLGLADLPNSVAPPETGTTFEENALIKARAAAAAHGLPALADDSGLEVDALNGMPGIRSARWAGSDATDEENLELLLRQIDDVPEADRRARFVSAMALVVPGAHGERREHVVRGEWPGHITVEPSGSEGFGYDPIFAPDNAKGTAAQLDPDEKDKRSHRGQALRLIMPLVAQTLAADQSARG